MLNSLSSPGNERKAIVCAPKKNENHVDVVEKQ